MPLPFVLALTPLVAINPATPPPSTPLLTQPIAPLQTPAIGPVIGVVAADNASERYQLTTTLPISADLLLTQQPVPPVPWVPQSVQPSPVLPNPPISVSTPANSVPLTTPLPLSQRPTLGQTVTPTPSPTLTPAPSPTPNPSTAGKTDPLQTTADRQEYDNINQVFTAIGNVLLQFRQAQLQADQVETNLNSQVVVANGNVRLTRGDQTLQGQYLEYNLQTDRGSFTNVSGVINLSRVNEDLSRGLPSSIIPDNLSPLPDQLGGRLNGAREPQTAPDRPATPSPTIDPNRPPNGGLVNGPTRTSGVQRLRFTAERIEFNAGRWVARNIRITNDPFDPAELELRADQASLVRLSPTDDLVTVKNGRIVFDQKVSIPLLRDRVVISRRRRDILPFDFGFDDDRGGLFVGRSFELIDKPRTSLVVNPQFFLQRAVNSSFNLSNLDLYGGTVRLFNQFAPNTSLVAFARFTSLDPDNLENNTRANFRLQQQLGRHRLAFEGSLRDRLFNGSLGEQNVRSSIGVVLDSPATTLGNSGLQFSYQVSTRFITAATRETDNDDDPGDPISLVRLQGVAALRRDFTLWRGNPLPPTASAGLRYTRQPVQPYFQLFTGMQAASNNYSNGDTQQALVGTIGIEGQFGHFSRNFFDSTIFRVSYSQVGNIGLSPFLFDRVADSKLLSFGFLQQIYGPLRAGLQGSFNLDSKEVFNTDVIVEYSRRTYGVVLRYSPDRQVGSFQLRINGFNWRGNPDPLLEPNVGTVEGGVIQPSR
jgi:lipopolysaccharide export system protein LptA